VGSYSIMVNVLLGITSPSATALQVHYEFFHTNMGAVWRCVPDSKLLMFMMRILCFIQIISINYINSKVKLQTLFVADPSFYPIELAIQNRLFHQFPAIPAQYLSEMNKAAGNVVVKARAALATPGNTSGTSGAPVAMERGSGK
jgi:hypothetical protein